MTTIKLKFRPSIVPGKEGSLYFQVIHKRVVRYFSTPYHIYAHEWNAKRETFCREIRPERSVMLLQIRGMVRQDLALRQSVINRLEAAGTDYTLDELAQHFAALPLCKTVFSFLQEQINHKCSMQSWGTARTYTNAFRRFRDFRMGIDLTFEELSAHMMEHYEAWLLERGLQRNTVSFYLRTLQTLYRKAVDEGVATHRHLFKHVRLSFVRTTKRAIPEVCLRAIGQLDLSSDARLSFARDMFMFSFYMRGMPFVDMAFLKKSDLKHGTICYSRKKTHQLLKVEWVKELQDIVNRYAPLTFGTPYMLPIISRADGTEYSQYRLMQEKVNRYLKKIGAMIALKIPLTTYVARHSWASMARNMDFSIAIISEAMGHNSYRTTQIYLNSIDLSKINQANRKIIRRIHAK